jgi:hypothetical protein
MKTREADVSIRPFMHDQPNLIQEQRFPLKDRSESYDWISCVVRKYFSQSF